jgi:small neutral amino acid transporter SnatA (MarC family)
MNRSTLFRIILVLLGIVSFVAASWFVLFGIVVMSDVPKSVGHTGYEILFVFFGLLLGLISIYLFCGAPHLFKFANSIWLKGAVSNQKGEK